jgi:DNA-binding transcriptional ArsR family regulator
MIEFVAPKSLGFASANTVAEIAAAIGDPARAAMLVALMDGRARTAGELAAVAGVAAPTASGHLARMIEAGLVAGERQGRHRYVRLVDPGVAAALESLMVVAAAAPARHRPLGPTDVALREARTCYDHLAGRLAVALADALVRRGAVVVADGAAIVTDAGRSFFCDFGVDRKSTRLNSSHRLTSRMPSSA